MKYLLVFVLLSTGARDERSVPSLAECQRQARQVTGDTRAASTLVFIGRNAMATCKPAKESQS